MATKIYKIENITLIDGTVIEIIPLKIKYLRKFMEAYQKIKQAKDDHEAIDYLLACAVISMEQYAPHLLKDKNYFEDNTLFNGSAESFKMAIANDKHRKVFNEFCQKHKLDKTQVLKQLLK